LADEFSGKAAKERIRISAWGEMLIQARTATANDP
jgi:hypothetical protein